MAAGVQHNDVACGGGVQVGQHALKVHAAPGGVVITVGGNFKASAGKEGLVVVPAGVGYQHLGRRRELPEKVRPDFQRAGAAQRLHGGHAAILHGGSLRAENKRLDGAVIGRQAVNGQIAARGLLAHQRLLGCLHALQQGQLAAVVKVNANAQVGLGGVGVSGELLVQTQDGVARSQLDSGEQGHADASRGVRDAPIVRTGSQSAPRTGSRRGLAQRPGCSKKRSEFKGQECTFCAVCTRTYCYG